MSPSHGRFHQTPTMHHNDDIISITHEHRRIMAAGRVGNDMLLNTQN